MSQALSPPGAAALPVSRRSLAPDLARGVMLLVIAIAHARILVTAFGGATAESTADLAVELLLPMFVDGRGYPMFAALFGYGLMGIYLRRERSGWEWPAIRALVRRRGRWLFVLGFAHVLLLFFGDILAVYGLVALTCAALLRVSDRRLLRHAAVWLVAGSAGYAVMLAFAGWQDAETGGGSRHVITDMAERVVGWLVFVPPMAVTTILPFLIGIWAARRRLLEEPERHRRLLRTVAGLGIPLGIVGGLPVGLHAAGIRPAESFGEFFVLEWLTTVTGYGAGLGYAALIGLTSVRIGERPGGIATALAACGQRSMTCYLLQSVAWTVLFPPYMIGLDSRLSPAAAVGVGAAVWLVTVGIAELMRRRDLRGPAETLLRSRTYR